MWIMLDGSKMARGRKKRKNIRKLVTRNPVMLAQMMRRRILLTVGSGALAITLSTTFNVETAPLRGDPREPD